MLLTPRAAALAPLPIGFASVFSPPIYLVSVFFFFFFLLRCQLVLMFL